MTANKSTVNFTSEMIGDWFYPKTVEDWVNIGFSREYGEKMVRMTEDNDDRK